ncbi:hypothetical protein A1O3_08193 [Capronia epimyces CBS 606.96]|uniref:Uncharacterized protein n=1 Tax=Capronia epimyces CBS 606.96 TaxID=1182542 RepID=W9XI86_9EURO|nr:uncharacterized protein A1O3_08193 [Capronia epimyces CBS 606.96]EXJ79908.1 hypothetical protein A1O3_08193 [Capronia epimyces CBS 606.96]
MFAPNSLSLPATFAHEHRPLRLTSESARPLPTGECRYPSHPSTPNQQCSCQSFHHNRSAPGNICDCGHQACYHVHDTTIDKKQTLDTILEKQGDKIKRLEETIQNERGNRETALQRERQMWEREVRILREALARFYQSEKEMFKKLHDIEDKVESNYDEQLRLRDRVVAADDAAISTEKRLEELEGGRAKRRRLGLRTQAPEEPTQNGHTSPDTMRRVSSSVDERSVHTPSSRALSPNSLAPVLPEAEEPRSSGILNLVELPRPTSLNTSQRQPTAQEEPRSSGFLNLDLAERHGQKAFSDHAPAGLHHAARTTSPHHEPSPPSYANSDPGVLRPGRTPPKVESGKEPVINVMVLPVDGSPRKRKHPLDHIALDVLADVTMASPLIH